MDKSNSPIGVFDSGMGGISVLKELYRLMPYEDYIFFGDSANAPYGVKPTAEVRALTLKGAEYLIKQGAKALVIACNTATSAAAPALREKYDIPVIGLEPAVKPAALSSEHPRVLVMATALTLREKKFMRIMEQYSGRAEIIPLPASELVRFVEAGLLECREIEEYLSSILKPYIENRVDCVVLGCTHFPFVKNEIRRVLGYPVEFFDGGSGTARETKRRILEDGICADTEKHGVITFENSCEKSLELSKRLFDI